MVFRLLGARKAGSVPLPPMSNQPTEILLANHARDLLHALPASDRQILGNVSGAISRLEQEADRLRGRLASIDQGLADVGSGGKDRAALAGELGREREAVTSRLATAVSALEGIRLDLLRLRAGVGDRPGLTTSIEQLKQLSAGVDALLETKE
jgi:serine/threonine-protein kinase